MKQTIKTSRVAGQLEKMFRALNSRFFGGELPEVVISLKKTAGAYGHFTTGKVWQTGEERRYEINISSASLNQECAFLSGVLVHEMVHEYCAEHGIKDTSNKACTTTRISSTLQKPTVWKSNTIPNMVGQLPAPALNFWILLRNRAGKISRWSKVSTYWMYSERSPRAATAVQAQKPERKSPAVPANIFVPNAATAAERPRSST